MSSDIKPDIEQVQAIIERYANEDSDVLAQEVLELINKAETRADDIILEKVTRFDLVDHRTNGLGRTQYNNVDVELSYQDDDRTLKVFLSDKATLTKEGEDSA